MGCSPQQILSNLKAFPANETKEGEREGWVGGEGGGG